MLLHMERSAVYIALSASGLSAMRLVIQCIPLALVYLDVLLLLSLSLFSFFSFY